jgi:hypothetical protein
MKPEHTGKRSPARNFLPSFTFDHYTAKHIRPLAVSPLNYPESVPNPWGFFVSEGFPPSATFATEGNA